MDEWEVESSQHRTRRLEEWEEEEEEGASMIIMDR